MPPRVQSRLLPQPAAASSAAVLARLLTPVALAGATMGLAANPAHALTLFTGPYAPANWTQSIEGDGSINTSGAPNSITLNGSDNGSGFSANTDFTISAPLGGTVSFNWFYTTNDDSSTYDPFGYLLNGIFNRLTNNGTSLPQSGSANFNVVAGDVFGFRQRSVDSMFGRASTTISNFNVAAQANAPVPGPLPLLGAGAALGWTRRLRQRIAQPLATPPQG